MHPVLLDLGPLKIQSYGATLVVAFLLSSVVALLAGRRLGASMETTLAIYFAAVFAFPVGAIVGGALVRDGPIDVFRMSFQLASGVLVATAGAVAAAVGLKRPAGSALDAVAIAALAGLALGRLGCFLGGCCSGRPTDLPWAVRFPLSTTVIPAELRGLDVHPTQLYLLVILLGAAVVLHGLAPRLAPGRAAPVGLAVLALSGLAISPLRAEPESGLAVAAWVTLLVFALGAAVRRSTNRAVG